jgi:ABC-2 type transport system permease protein
MGFFGVLEFTSEHATGLIRTTFAAVPRRRGVLAAKAAVAGVVTLVLGELLSFATFFLVQAILSGHHRSVSLSHPGVLDAVTAEGTFLFLISMIGIGLGAIVRQTAGAVAALLGLLAAPAIFLFLPAPWSDIIGRFTPLFSAEQVVALHPRTELFSPASSMVVLVAWPAVVLVVAAILISRRDV